ncbi:MAG: M1 family metallopeptidase [Desulfosalsimonas sp.]
MCWRMGYATPRSDEYAGQSPLLFSLAEGADIRKLTLNGEAADYSFKGGRLAVDLTENNKGSKATLAIEYAARFDDPYEPEPYAMDNPGQGVVGTMTENAVFLLGGSGWYPLSRAETVSIRLTVRGPAGMFAVTGGRAIAHETIDGQSVSRWDIDRVAGPQPLFAGHYEISHASSDHVGVSTYFFPQTAPLSDRYISAARRHLQFFEDLHGDYLFPKFAVVENFFPTGYGFPSFTLLGTRVLRLPFIPETSLRHEIAHCWWGNGVLVDYEAGNWSEGLTTYVSEHLSKERKSAKAARIYRMRALTDYALLAAGSGDFALRKFRSRNSPASQAVGYGKAMFVFHMARRKIGDDNFWAALRSMYQGFSFSRAKWTDFKSEFVSASNWPKDEAEAFFSQWIERKGAPRLYISKAETTGMGDKWKTTVVIAQKKPYYALDVPVRVTTGKGDTTRILRLEGPAAEIDIKTDGKPQVLAVDPEAHVFRLLSDEEIPPTVNSIKGSDDLAAVFSAGVDEDLVNVFRGLLRGLNHPDLRIIDEQDLAPGDLAGCDVIFFGYPATESGRDASGPMPAGVEISAERFAAAGQIDSRQADSGFIAFKDPAHPERIKAFFVFDKGLSSHVVERTARKITHYGNYGLLAFRKTQNLSRDALPPEASPLRVQLGEKQ